jgi:antitoxin component YwqK of YwqJK toxin-antitoxin module
MEKNGLYTDYYSSGGARIYGRTVDNKLYGPEIEYDKNGSMTRHKFYHRYAKSDCNRNEFGKNHGTCVYYMLERPLYVYTFFNGVLHGTCTEYYLNGDIFSEYEYVNGEPHGERIVYYQNNNKASVNTYVYGILHGISTWYDRNGNIIKSFLYENGNITKSFLC